MINELKENIQHYCLNMDSILKTEVGAHRRCCYGLCKSDPRTRDYYENCNFYFISFPKPCLPFRKRIIQKSGLKKHLKECQLCNTCDRWVRLCGRCDLKFNSIYNVKKDTYICSLHFVGESGPTEKFPEPIPFRMANKQKSSKIRIPRRSLQEKYKAGQNEKLAENEKDTEIKIENDLNFFETEVTNYEELLMPDDVTVKTEVIEDDIFDAEFNIPMEAKIIANTLELETALSSENNLITVKYEPVTLNVKSTGVQTTETFSDYKKPVKQCSRSKPKGKPIEIFESSLEKDKAKSVFYTGLDNAQIKILMSFLSPKCDNLTTYSDENGGWSDSRERELTPKQKLIITLVFLRCAFSLQDIGYRFELPVSVIKNIIHTWIEFMFKELCEQLKPSMFVPRQKPGEKKSELFDEFQNLRAILVCSEFYSPPLALFNFENEDHPYSKKESSIVSKALIGCTPTGRISFVSPIYEGSASNREIFVKSNLDELLEKDDLILVDKEILIEDLIRAKSAEAKVPQFFKENRILQSSNDFKTILLHKQKNFVQQVVNRIKQFRILQTEPSYGTKKLMSEILFVCVCISNLNIRKR